MRVKALFGRFFDGDDMLDRIDTNIEMSRFTGLKSGTFKIPLRSFCRVWEDRIGILDCFRSILLYCIISGILAESSSFICERSLLAFRMSSSGICFKFLRSPLSMAQASLF